MSQLSMFSSEDPPAKASASRGFERDLLTHEETSCSRILQSLGSIAPSGFFGRTSPVSCPSTEDGLLGPSSGGWQNSGMGSPTGFLTLSTSEFPSDGAACSLSDILETGDVPRRFYLSAKACAGILRRAAKRGKELPRALKLALEAVAGVGEPTSSPGGSFATSGGLIPVAFESRFVRNGRGAPSDVVPPLKAQSGQSGKGDAAPLVAGPTMQVRRITPTEAERLQGFPDGWTEIPFRGKPAADGPRYKALGNSMAVPVMRFIGDRIALVKELSE